MTKMYVKFKKITINNVIIHDKLEKIDIVLGKLKFIKEHRRLLTQIWI